MWKPRTIFTPQFYSVKTLLYTLLILLCSCSTPKKTPANFSHPTLKANGWEASAGYATINNGDFINVYSGGTTVKPYISALSFCVCPTHSAPASGDWNISMGPSVILNIDSARSEWDSVMYGNSGGGNVYLFSAKLNRFITIDSAFLDTSLHVVSGSSIKLSDRSYIPESYLPTGDTVTPHNIKSDWVVDTALRAFDYYQYQTDSLRALGHYITNCHPWRSRTWRRLDSLRRDSLRLDSLFKKESVTISGNGTVTDPYIIKDTVTLINKLKNGIYWTVEKKADRLEADDSSRQNEIEVCWCPGDNDTGSVSFILNKPTVFPSHYIGGKHRIVSHKSNEARAAKSTVRVNGKKVDWHEAALMGNGEALIWSPSLDRFISFDSLQLDTVFHLPDAAHAKKQSDWPLTTDKPTTFVKNKPDTDSCFWRPQNPNGWACSIGCGCRKPGCTSLTGAPLSMPRLRYDEDSIPNGVFIDSLIKAGALPPDINLYEAQFDSVGWKRNVITGSGLTLGGHLNTITLSVLRDTLTVSDRYKYLKIDGDVFAIRKKDVWVMDGCTHEGWCTHPVTYRKTTQTEIVRQNDPVQPVASFTLNSNGGNAVDNASRIFTVGADGVIKSVILKPNNKQ